MKKRLLCLALALALAFSLCAPALAADDMPADEKVIYDQLSSDAKKVFNVLNTKENLACFRSGQDIVLTGFTGSYSSASERDAKYQYCFDIVNDAYSAILQIYPGIFWLSGINLNLSGSDNGSSFSATITISFYFHDEWTTGGRSVYADEATVHDAVAAIAEEASVQGGPWDQLLYVHDWLTAHNVYNSAAAASGAGSHWDYLPWTPVSAVTDESQPVCEGYARAFKLACDELGYPCLFVVGYGNSERHGWNMVQVAGKWYAVDVTFDDPAVNGVNSVVSGHEKHDYFMVGEETLIDGYHIFSDNHIPDGAVTRSTSFTYPALAPEALDPSFTWGPGDIDEPEDPDEPGEDDEPQPLRFADVDETAYYAPAVEWAVMCGVTNGTKLNDENGLNWFSPDATVTRGQAVTFLWRAMWEPEPETQSNPFTDVSPKAYYYDAVLWAVENGITNGVSADSFAPNAPVTRGQLLTFLWRTVGKPGATGEGAWYADAERWAAEFGIAEGTAEAYATGAKCPRSDVVYYLYHAILTMAG